MSFSNQGSPGKTRPRRLLLCLDGVPHKIIQAAKSRGMFDAFNTATRLLSPFPTMTNVALSAMLEATPPAGYESLYFDRNAGHMSGGVRKYIGRRTPDKIPSSYMDDLDYQEPLMFEFLIYVAPERVWRADMRRFRERFLEAPQTRDYFAFLKATDGLLHAQGPERLNVALAALDKILAEILRTSGSETEIVLFSDHGMNLEENRRVDVVTQLSRRGFLVASQLSNSGRSLSIPAFGLCSYVAIYCAHEDLIPETSNTVIELPGVDFAIFRDGDAVVLNSSRGAARIERGDGEVYRYLPCDGDPLQLASKIGELRALGKTDEDGFMTATDWFTSTNNHLYPNVVVNLYKALFTARVQHTADILVSLLDGYYYGWSAFGKFVKLLATHGNALASSSNAFLMSTHREFPECVQADEAKRFLLG